MVMTEDVNILWDGEKEVFIRVSPTYERRLIGLCGLYDGNSTNDFTPLDQFSTDPKRLKFFANPTQDQINSFATSFKRNTPLHRCEDKNLDHKPSCYDPNGDTRKGYMTAEKVCSALDHPVFKPCEPYVKRDSFISMCRNAVCNTNYTKHHDAFCDVLSLYAHVCAWHHNITIAWRPTFREFCRKYITRVRYASVL